jgi:NitT/TauT family transport system permease protein
MKQKLWRGSWPPILLAAILFTAWQAAVFLTGVSDLVLPTPSHIVAVMFAKGALYLKHLVPTLIETIVGYAAALVLGTACGMLIAFSRVIGPAVYPVLVAAQIMPKVAVAPLLVVWFGFGLTPKLTLTALIAYFPIVINTIVALNMTSQESIYLFRSMGAGPVQTFFKLRLPTALPVYFSGLKVGATLAVIGVVVAEFYSSERGLGYLLLLQVSNADTAGAFGSIAYLTLMGLAIFGAIAQIERLAVPAHMRKRYDTSAGA